MDLEKYMLNIKQESAIKLASDIGYAHSAIDDALINIATLTKSMIDVCRDSNIPPATSQAAIEHVASGLTQLVDARKGFVNAHRKIIQIQSLTNVRETNFGCVGISNTGDAITGARDIGKRQPLHVVNG